MAALRGQGQWALGYREPLNANERFKEDSDPLTVKEPVLEIDADGGLDSVGAIIGAVPRPPVDRPPPATATESSQFTDVLVVRLRGVPLRVTEPRIAVLRAVHATPHADTDQLIAEARRALPTVSHQAVYNVLRALTEAGLVRRIQPPGSSALYESTAEDHHHAVCRECSAITDVPVTAGDALLLTGRQAVNFQIETAEIFYGGRCLACAPA